MCVWMQVARGKSRINFHYLILLSVRAVPFVDHHHNIMTLAFCNIKLCSTGSWSSEGKFTDGAPGPSYLRVGKVGL
jgi:hypothetical protein